MNQIAINHVRTLSLLILFFTQFNVIPGDQSSTAVVREELQPVEPIVYRVVDEVVEGNSRRRLAPFQLCLACKCCTAAAVPTSCATMPCCFGIDCQLPNKPFGVCAFVPKTCNCTACAV
ncbi:uncharacterized protein LOC132286682 [Cornus florida]|uniref:uncharacterized protein LOC132286682 n=1 Tax=Cornus florida TaxID=4283 RepID=UPI00289E2601|nr:uncharacterized protein LOC132286682 [Cornus florida]